MKSKFLVCLALAVTSAYAQDDSGMSMRRNTIKLDLTSHWLYRNAVVFNYERVINNKRSWSVMAGYQQLPQVRVFGSNIAVVRDASETGFKFGGEYRFYLTKENKFAAPHGIYIGPYFTYLRFSNGRDIQVNVSGTPEPAALSTQFDVINLGVQIGYQFVFNDRWTIDLSFMGPSLSHYKAQMGLSGNFTFDPDEVSNEILKELINRFPALGDLLSGNTLVSKGSADTWAFGYRYQIQVGYRFGKKK